MSVFLELLHDHAQRGPDTEVLFDEVRTKGVSYGELDDPLTWQAEHAAYVSLVTARGLNATFSNIIFTTSAWNAAGWAPQPTEYIDLNASIASGSTATGGSYSL